MQKKLNKSHLISFIFLFVLAPAFVTVSSLFMKSKSYYAGAVIVIICALAPFFISFEKKKIHTGEIVIIALMTALAVASRAAMMFIPQVKPACAIVIITAIAFAPHSGFLTGALTMLLSNFIFGQGMFTPFQMLGMGLTGFICGILLNEKKKKKSALTVALTGGIVCFAVYGFIADSCSVLMLSSAINLKSALAFYASGMPFNLIHALTTAAFLFVIKKPMTEKFSRLRIKYGIYS